MAHVCYPKYINSLSYPVSAIGLDWLYDRDTFKHLLEVRIHDIKSFLKPDLISAPISEIKKAAAN